MVFVFAGAVLLPYLANAILALRREMVYGGLIIDARGSQIILKNDKRLDGGVIVVTRSGHVAMTYNSQGMKRASVEAGKPVYVTTFD